jgi:diguanylate cyclase (GGDEF)-like protein/PAS domain S-box-containing protein
MTVIQSAISLLSPSQVATSAILGNLKTALIEDAADGDPRSSEIPGAAKIVRRWLGRLLVVAAIAIGGVVLGFRPEANELLIICALLFTGVGLIGRIDQLTFRQILQDMNLRGSNALMRKVVDTSFDGMILVDADGRIELTNTTAGEIFDCAPRDFVGCHIERVIPGLVEDGESLETALVQASVPHETVAQRRDGSLIPIDLVVNSLHFGDRQLFVAILRDITERKAQREKLEHIAHHDALTGLTNRVHLQGQMETALTNARSSGGRAALMLLDLDRFKEINDTLGHSVGDGLLIEVARRLTDSVGEECIIARLGGDEFAIFLPTVTVADDVAAVAQLIANVLREPFGIEDLALEVGVSIGVAIFPEHGLNANQMLRSADVAMYVAKREQTVVAVYDEERDNHSVRNLALSGELRQAMEEDQLSVHFQPQIDLSTGKVAGAEALVRWQNPRHGAVMPDEFITVAEQMGIMGPLTRWIMNAALTEAAKWKKAGVDLGVSVNLSARNLHQEDLPETVADLLERHGVAPDHLVLEITESAFMTDPTRALSVMHELHAIGVRLAIDDFGTGYSSLSYLQRLPVDEIKVDKSFVMHMDGDNNDEAIVRATVDLAHSLGLSVVAEGVEEPQHVDRLKALGCDVIQGYYVSPPMPAEDFMAWLEDSPWQHRKDTSSVESVEPADSSETIYQQAV